MTIPEQAVEKAWPTHCIHGRSVNGPEWCPDCKRIGLDPEVTDVAWKILQALHENVAEAERPMSWSDVNGDQEQRIRAAAVAAIETIRTRDAQPLVGVQRPEDVAGALCEAAGISWVSLHEGQPGLASWKSGGLGTQWFWLNLANAVAIRRLSAPASPRRAEGEWQSIETAMTALIATFQNTSGWWDSDAQNAYRFLDSLATRRPAPPVIAE